MRFLETHSEGVSGNLSDQWVTLLPRRYLYWEKSPYVGSNLVANAMRLNRFEVIEALFVQENARLDPDDRFASSGSCLFPTSSRVHAEPLTR